MAVQETWISTKTLDIKIKDYKVIKTSPNDTRGTGVAFIIKNNIKIKNIFIKNLYKGIEYISIVVIFKNFRNIKFVSIYIHPYAKKEDIEYTLNNLNLKNTIIMGDFNAHSRIWSQGQPNQRGNLIEEYLKENNMKILDLKLKPTYCPLNKDTKNSSPDLVAYKNNLKAYIKNGRIGIDIGSDHLPIIFNIKQEKITTTISRNKHWILNSFSEKDYLDKIKNDMNELEDNKKCSYYLVSKIILKSPDGLTGKAYGFDCVW